MPDLNFNRRFIPVNVMDKRDRRAMDAYAHLPPEKTHTKEELAALHNAIHFTHNFLDKESKAKMTLPDGLVLPEDYR